MELAKNYSFFHVLKYMYTGQLILKNQKLDRMFDFMSIAKTLELTNLSDEISMLLQEGITIENVVLIYEKANSNDQKQLKKSCETFIDKNADVLVSKKSLIKLSSECMKEILDRDSFGLNEAKIFELVNEWHDIHNRTEYNDIELIKKIRFELIQKEELSNLTNKFKSISNQLVNQIKNERAFNENKIIPTRQSQTSIPTTSTQITTFSTINNKLASGSADNSIKIWNIDSGECIKTLIGHSGAVLSLQVLAKNKLASGSADNSTRIWNIDSGKCRILTGHSGYVFSLELLANNKLASGSSDGLIKVWNVDSGECIQTLNGHSSDVLSLKFLNNSNKLVSGSKSIKIWNVDSGVCIRTLTDHSDFVNSLQLLANNKLASGSSDHSIKIWDVNSGECIRTLKGHFNFVRSLEVLANYKIASGSEDKSIKIWSYDSDIKRFDIKCTRTLNDHTKNVWSLQQLPNNKLASGSADNSIKIWNIDSDKCIRTLTGHSGAVYSLEFLSQH